MSSTTLPPFHLALPVHDINAARHFYGEVLGFDRGRSSDRWTDWNVDGHQVVTHQVDDHRNAVAGTNPVDGHDVPVPHFGLVLSVDRFQELAHRLTKAGGGALALLPADRVVCAQHAWLSPLPPEGASAIIHRTTDRAPEMAQSQGVRPLDLLRDGIVDRVVAEHPDAADEPQAYLKRVARVLEYELTTLLRQDSSVRLAARLSRYRHLGT